MISLRCFIYLCAHLPACLPVPCSGQPHHPASGRGLLCLQLDLLALRTAVRVRAQVRERRHHVAARFLTHPLVPGHPVRLHLQRLLRQTCLRPGTQEDTLGLTCVRLGVVAVRDLWRVL